MLVDGVGDWIEVVTGLYVLTLSDEDTTELELLEVQTELEDGVDTEELLSLLLISLEELSIDVDNEEDAVELSLLVTLDTGEELETNVETEELEGKG